MTPWILLLALATPVAVPADASTPVVPPAPVAGSVEAPAEAVVEAPMAPAPAANEAFVQSVAIACPAGATRSTFPLVPNTLFELETLNAVSTKTSKPGHPFELRLREPLRYGAVELVPAGTPVHGEITHVSENRFGGIAGEMILATRYVQLPQGRLRLKASISASGKSHIGGAGATVVLFGIAGMFIQGGNKELPVGSPLSARLAEPVTFHCEGATPPSSLPSTPEPATTP